MACSKAVLDGSSERGNTTVLLTTGGVFCRKLCREEDHYMFNKVTKKFKLWQNNKAQRKGQRKGGRDIGKERGRQTETETETDRQTDCDLYPCPYQFTWGEIGVDTTGILCPPGTSWQLGKTRKKRETIPHGCQIFINLQIGHTMAVYEVPLTSWGQFQRLHFTIPSTVDQGSRIRRINTLYCICIGLLKISKSSVRNSAH